MKIWRKIFLYSYILFFIIFGICGMTIVESIYSRNMNRGLSTAIDKHKDIVNTIYMNSDLLGEDYEIKSLLSMLTGYISVNSKELVNIEVFENYKRIINMGKEVKPLDGGGYGLGDSSTTEVKFFLEEFDDKRYVFAYSNLVLNSIKYQIVVTSDISYLNKERNENYIIFLILSIFAMILLGLGLYLISKKLTEPLEVLSEITTEIKNGDYHKRSECKNKDEIGILSNNFNSMIDVIEENITELERVNDEKQRFIDNLTHEMKTPITSIMGYSDLLLKGNINEKIREKAIKHINMQGHRLENLSTSMTKLIQVRNIKIKRDNYKIEKILNRCIENVHYKLETKKMEIVSNIHRENILVEKDLIEVLIDNIIDNAIKASEKGSKIKIYGGKSPLNKTYKLVIQDFGGGIEKDELKKIKEPFYMVDKSRACRTKNMGLGLAICTDICALNKIKFDIESEVCKGTKVILYFELGDKEDENGI